MLEFFKYQGTGNDFVMIDNRDGKISLTQLEIEKICHRRFGIGADGLILIENENGFDFKMRYFNADGAESSMCGNGGRCAIKFASDLEIFKNKTHFIAVDGKHEGNLNSESVSLGMINPSDIEQIGDDYFINTGSPHLIRFVDDLENIDIKTLGAEIRYSKFWMDRGGTNVNFVKINSENTISVRTYERGVEDETFSCGTGVTAAAIISNYKFNLLLEIRVTTLGGELTVNYNKIEEGKYDNVYLNGPAICVFKGSLII